MRRKIITVEEVLRMRRKIITVEELRDYCQQLCEEGKGGVSVKAGLRGYEDRECSKYDGDVIEVMLDEGELRLDVEQTTYLSRPYLISLLEEVQKGADEVRKFLPQCGYDVHDDMESELDDLDNSIQNMMVELREDN